MYLDRDYRPRRRRRGVFARFWPLFLLAAVAVVLYQTRPTWISPKPVIPTPTPTQASVVFLAEAESALARADYAAAIAAYARAAQLEPADPQPLIMQARLQMIQQDVAASYKAAAQAVKLAPKNADALSALARAEDWLNQYDPALNHALDALDADPNNAETLAVLAEIYTDVGNLDIAQQYSDKALAADPQNILALRNQAYLLEKRGKYPAALEALDKALAIDHQRADLYLEKARIYRIGLADFTKAIESYRAAVDASKTPLTLDALGEGLYNVGDHLQAVRVLREALQLDPSYGPALVHLGMALYARRNYEDASTSLEQGLAIVGDNTREEYLYTAGLAHIYKDPPECNQAIPWLRKALAKNPDSGPALAGLKMCAGGTPNVTP